MDETTVTLPDPTLTLPDPIQRPTIGVEEAGRLLGVGRKAAYHAVGAGQIPSIRVGRLLRVPTASVLTMLGVSDEPTS